VSIILLTSIPHFQSLLHERNSRSRPLLMWKSRSSRWYITSVVFLPRLLIVNLFPVHELESPGQLPDNEQVPLSEQNTDLYCGGEWLISHCSMTSSPTLIALSMSFRECTFTILIRFPGHSRKSLYLKSFPAQSLRLQLCIPHMSRTVSKLVRFEGLGDKSIQSSMVT